MNLLFLIAKIVIVALFLFMFLRTSKVIWGIGLLTVTSAIFLDTFLGTFGREEIIQQFGFFFYVIVGALFAGGAVWLWGLLRPYTRAIAAERTGNEPPADPPDDKEPVIASSEPQDVHHETYENSELHEIITVEFSEDELLDLLFDMDYFEETSAIIAQDTSAIANTIFETAESRNQKEELRLAVERIQNPLPPEYLPRIEKIHADSPQTILRQYLVANCTLADLEEIGTALNIAWDAIPGAALNAKARNLLQDVYSRDQQEELIELLRQRAADDST